MENTQKKKKIGRPPGAPNKIKTKNTEFKFKNKYCEDLIDHMKTGSGFTTFTKYLGDKYGLKFAAPKSILDQWVMEYKDFDTALKKGMSYREAYWENNAKAAAAGKLTYLKSKKTHVTKNKDGTETTTTEEEHALARMNAAIIIYILKTQFKDSGYVERMELTGKDGQSLTMAQIAKKASEMRAKLKDE